MVPWMKGSGSQEDRHMRMCIGAKLCSGKAITEEDAHMICSQPKLPKLRKKNKESPKACLRNVEELTECIISKMESDPDLLPQLKNINKLPMILGPILSECMCAEVSNEQ
jgi:hypothetical protein